MPFVFKVLNKIASTVAPLHSTISSICSTWAVGLTVIVNSFDGPIQSAPAFVYVGVTTTIAVSVSVVSLVICWLISPAILASKPISSPPIDQE